MQLDKFIGYILPFTFGYLGSRALPDPKIEYLIAYILVTAIFHFVFLVFIGNLISNHLKKYGKNR